MGSYLRIRRTAIIEEMVALSAYQGMSAEEAKAYELDNNSDFGDRVLNFIATIDGLATLENVGVPVDSIFDLAGAAELGNPIAALKVEVFIVEKAD